MRTYPLKINMKTMDWCGLAKALVKLCNKNGLVIEAALLSMAYIQEEE